MQAGVNCSIPAPVDGDADGVCWALSTATSLWAVDPRESVKWLRRAAEAAREAGQTARGEELLRTVARLQSRWHSSGSGSVRSLDEAPPTTRTPESMPRTPPRSTTPLSVECVAVGQQAKAKPPPLPHNRTPVVRALPSPDQSARAQPARNPAQRVGGSAAYVALRVAVRVVGGVPTVEPLPQDRVVPVGSFAAVLVPLDAADGERLMAWQRSFSRAG
jgi:hypothetical protein